MIFRLYLIIVNVRKRKPPLTPPLPIGRQDKGENRVVVFCDF
jgi:hypothetical protein